MSSFFRATFIVSGFTLLSALAPALSTAPADVYYRQCVIGCVGEMEAGQCETSCSCVRDAVSERLSEDEFAILNQAMRDQALNKEQREMMTEIGEDCARQSDR